MIPCSEGDFLSRLLLPLVFSAAKLAVQNAANEYRRLSGRARSRPRRSKQQEQAVATIATFIGKSRAIYALNRTVVERGNGRFSASVLSETYRLLADLGVIRFYRDTRDGHATGKQMRLLDEDAVKALVVGLPSSDIDHACRIVWRLPLAQAAFATLPDLCAWVDQQRWQWGSLPRSAAVEDLITQCAMVEVDGVSRDAPEAGRIISRREAFHGSPIEGWDEQAGSDLTPLREDQTPKLSVESNEGQGRPDHACGVRDDVCENFVDHMLTGQETYEHAHPVTQSQGNTDTDMPNLTGRPVMTKQEEIAANALRKQQSKAARAQATTSRVLGDLPAATGPDTVTVEAMRAKLADAKGDDGLFGEFVERMNAYGWRGLSQKQVNQKVSLWFSERLQNGAFAPKAGDSKSEATVDHRLMFKELCGNADTPAWAAKIEAAGLSRFEDQALASAERISAVYAKTRASNAGSWEGVKRIAAMLKTCAYLFHIARVEENDKGGLTVYVLHPQADVAGDQIASQAQADSVAKVISAITGRDVTGVAHSAAWVPIGARKLEAAHAF